METTMVLEQKTSAMTEHNTPPAAGQSSDLHQAHSKKLSLASRLKKRRTRQTGAESPVPNECASMESSSRSPVRDTKSTTSTITDQTLKSDDDTSTSCTPAPPHTDVASTSSATKSSAPKSAKPTNGSMGSSLLHNKRRAMHMAKTRRENLKERSPARPVDKAATSASLDADDNAVNKSSANPVAPSTSSQTPTTRTSTASEPPPATTNMRATSAVVQKKEAPYEKRMDENPSQGVESETDPNQGAISEPPPLATESRFQGNSQTKQSLRGFKPLVQKTEDVEKSPSTDVVSSESVVSADRGQAKTKPPSLKSIINTNREREQAKTLASSMARTSPKPHTDEKKNQVAEEMVPWEPEEPEKLVSSRLYADDDDRYSQVSTGRSVISNGVVDYDESIMSLARLDNFRSKSNQEKAEKTVNYPGSSGLGNQGSVSPMDEAQSLPTSAAKAASQRKTTHLQESRPQPVKKPSWLKSPSTPVEKNSKVVNEAPASNPISHTKGKFNRQPSWMKSPPSEKTTDPVEDAPPSPTPSSSFSSASCNRRSSFGADAAAKFGSSRSETGVESAPVSSSLPVRNWRASPIVKKQAFLPAPTEQLLTSQGNSRSTGPASLQKGHKANACHETPAPEQTLEPEETTPQQESNVPKAKSWSVKKHEPSWTKRGTPASMKTPPPRVRHSDASWMKSKQQAGDNADPEEVEQPSRVHSSSTPSWVKPAAGGSDDALSQSEVSPPVPTTRTWSVNKQTPSWMKKSQEPQEAEEKPPAPMPTTKTWSAKKTTPAWMKRQAEPESDPSSPRNPSPGRRKSAPLWLKHGQADVAETQEITTPSPVPTKDRVMVATTPQSTSSWKKPTVPTSDLDKLPSPPVAASSKSWRDRSPGVVEQKAPPSTSPRTQSWKPSQPPSTEKPPTGSFAPPKSRHSIGGTVSLGITKKQRCPSPSVAQLQEQIFVEKLGVASESRNPEPKKLIKPQKGPSMPSPQVKELQKRIFSLDKKKSLDEHDEKSTSPAAGWWKRVPNPPEINPEHFDDPGWKHEASSTCAEEHPSISPSPTTASEPASSNRVWKNSHPENFTHSGAPSWLKDVAAFHSSSPKQLPSQPPIWQQPEPQARESLKLPPEQTEVGFQHSENQSSSVARKDFDEGASDLMVVSSGSTTTRDDVVVQQEDTKSLIQMAADSVLIADYEQAMQRVIAASKSVDEDESVGNSVENTLPKELPLEFQKALTLSEEEGKAGNGMLSKPKELAESTERQNTLAPEEPDIVPEPAVFEEEKAAQKKFSSTFPAESEILVATNHSKETEPSNLDSATHNDDGLSRQVSQQSDTTPLGVLFGEPSISGATGEDASNNFGGHDATGSRTHLQWPEHVTDVAITEEKPQESFDRQSFQETEAAHRHTPSKAQVDETQTGTSSTSFCNSDPNFSGVEQDENGFPCGPNEGGDTAGGFDFNSDPFGSQPWTEGASDEKKEASEILPYWSSEMEDSFNDSSAEWANRDPALDSVPMASPEPAEAEKVIATAEKILKKWSNSSPLVEEYEQSCVDEGRNVYEDPALEGWVDPSLRSRPKQDTPQQVLDDTWDVHDLSGLETIDKNYETQANQLVQNLPDEREDAWESPARTPERQIHNEEVLLADPMWGSPQAIDETWGSSAADPFAAPAGQFDVVDSEEKPRGDVFDPFGEDDDTIPSFDNGKLFADPNDSFVAVDSFTPPAFAATQSARNKQYQGSRGTDIFDTYYYPHHEGEGGMPLKPVSGEMENNTSIEI